MPGSAGVVHEAGKPAAAFDLDQAQAARAERLQPVGGAQLRNLDARPAAARMTDVPAGTVTGLPSISA